MTSQNIYLPVSVTSDSLNQIPNKKEKLMLFIQQSSRSLSAVFLCLLVNLLDAVSYGAILFPPNDPNFKEYSIDAISIFLVGTIVSQFIFSWFSSFKKGVSASIMVEVIPYIHLICYSAARNAPTERVMPTVIFCLLISTFLIGVVFYLMAVFNFDVIVYLFPRFVYYLHIVDFF